MPHEKCPNCGEMTLDFDGYGNGYYCFPNAGGCGEKFPFEINEINGLYQTIVFDKKFMNKKVIAFFHGDYLKYYLGDPFSKFILNIKDHANDIVKEQVSNLVKEDLSKIIALSSSFEELGEYQQRETVVITVPRSKIDTYYSNPFETLQFRVAVSMGVKKSNHRLIDGTRYLMRTTNTFTTHKGDNPDDPDPHPYRGITQDTCSLEGDINDRPVILIDDIYTTGVGIDEDCIQFLLANGASNVILYTLGRTKK